MKISNTLVFLLLLASAWIAAPAHAVEDDNANSYCSTQGSMALFAAVLRDSGLSLAEASAQLRARFKERFGPEVTAGRMSATVYEFRITMADLALHAAYRHKLDPMASYAAARDSCRQMFAHPPSAR